MGDENAVIEAPVQTTEQQAPEAAPAEPTMESQRSDLLGALGIAETSPRPPAPDPEPTRPTTPTTPRDPKPATEIPPGPGTPPATADKAAREQERRDKSWQALNQQKEQLRRDREEFERGRTAQRTPSRGDYAMAALQSTQAADAAMQNAARLEEAGKFEEAEAQKAKAQELRVWAKAYTAEAQKAAEASERQQAPQTPQPIPAEQREVVLQQSYARVRTEFPEVITDPTLNKAVVEFMGQHPECEQFADGPYATVKYLTDFYKAAGVPGLMGEVSQLRKRVKELEGLTTPARPGGQPTPGGQKPFEDMTTEEMRGVLVGSLKAG